MRHKEIGKFHPEIGGDHNRGQEEKERRQLAGRSLIEPLLDTASIDNPYHTPEHIKSEDKENNIKQAMDKYTNVEGWSRRLGINSPDNVQKRQVDKKEKEVQQHQLRPERPLSGSDETKDIRGNHHPGDEGTERAVGLDLIERYIVDPNKRNEEYQDRD